MKPLAVVAVLLVAAALLRTSAAREKGSPPVTLSVRYRDSDGGRTIAEAAIQTEPGKPFHLISGGESEPRFGAGKLEFGTRMTGQIDHQRTGEYVIAFELRSGNRLHLGEGKKKGAADVVETEVIEVRTMMRIGEELQLPCRGTLRCDLRLEPGGDLFPKRSGER